MKLNKLRTHFTRWQWLAIASLHGVGLLIVAFLGLYGNPGDTAFIQGCVLELAFALFSNWFNKPGFILYLIYSIVAVALPIFLAFSDSAFRPAGPSFFMYIVTTNLMSLFRSNLPLPDWFIVPSYIPSGFKQVDYWTTRQGSYIRDNRSQVPIPLQPSGGLIYENGRRRLSIRGYMDVPYEPRQSRYSVEHFIKGVSVFVDKQEPGLNYKGIPISNFALITASWIKRGYIFEVKMDANDQDEVLKVIASMIPDEPESSSQKEGV